MIERFHLVTIGIALTATSIVCAATSVPVVQESAVKFEAAGPAGLKINGESTGVKAAEADGKITLTVPMTQFHTGIGLRDKHLREAIETDKHPDATLTVDRSSIKLPASGSSTGTASGTLTFHGVTKPAPFNYSIAKKGDSYQVHAEFSVALADYQVKKPCYLGVCVGDVVKVATDLTVLGS